MPRVNKESTLSRQWELMKLLPSRLPGKTSSELRTNLVDAGYEVTKRTIERDLVDLAKTFSLLSNQSSKPYRWYWEKSAPLTISAMNLPEAVSLGLLENLLRQLVPDTFYRVLRSRFDQARKKLGNLSNNQYAEWADIVRYIPPGISFLPPDIPANLMHEVQNALLQKKQLKIEYRPADASQSKELLIHPLAMVQQGVRPYLLATTFNYDKPVFYALHRMDSAVPTREKSRRPKGFSLEKFMDRGGAQFGGGKNITLKAKISGSLAALLKETPLSTDQRIVVKKQVQLLTATVFDSWQLRFWVLSQGASILIQQPKALKNDIVAELEEALKSYSENQLPQ